MIHLEYLPVKTNVYALLKVIVKTKILAIPYGMYFFLKKKFPFSIFPYNTQIFWGHFGHVKIYGLVRYLIVY